MRSARALKAAGPRSISATSTAPAAALAVAPTLPASGADRSGPSAATTAASPHSTSIGLNLQQAFAAHSLAQLGGDPSGHSDPSRTEVDAVAALLRVHVAEMFSLAPAPPASPAPGMCATPPQAPHQQHSFPGSSSSSLRQSTRAVAARLTKQIGCPLEAGTPYTLEGAMQPSTQPRLVVDIEPPFTVTWANPAWEALAGLEWGAVEGQPCLDVVQGSAVNAGRLESLAEAMQDHVRGSTVLEYNATAVRVTCTPLVSHDGSKSRMLLVFSPAPPQGL